MHGLVIKGLLVGVVLLSVTPGCSEKPAEPATDAPRKAAPAVNTEPKRREFRVRKDSIEVRGNSLSYPLHIDALSKVIGPHSRQEEGANTLYVWDDLGICAYTKTRSEITDLAFAIAKEPLHKLWPKFTYQHDIAIGPHVITPTWGKLELGRAGFKSLEFVWEIDVDDVHVVVTMDEKTSSKVIEVSVTLPKRS